MDDSSKGPNSELELLMGLAASGDKDAALKFLKLFFASTVFVPERYQSQPIAGEPKYPNDFVWLMGVQDGDRVIVPAFTQEELVEDWAAINLSYKAVRGEDLLAAMPPDWWLWLNPGLEVEKEFSPWEVAQLKSGPESIDAVMDEIFPEEIVEPLSVTQLPDDSLPGLRKELIKFAEDRSSVLKLFLLQEEGKNFEGEVLSHILVGVEAEVSSSDEVELLRDEIQKLGAPHTIGGDPLKVLVGRDVKDGLFLSLFKDASPFFERKRSGSRSLYKKLFGRLAKGSAV